jgi:hypothetical protein
LKLSYKNIKEMDDNAEQRKAQAKKAREDFIELWREHTKTLSSERRKTVEIMLEGDPIDALRNIGYQFKPGVEWKPKSRKSLAIWNGNPYAGELALNKSFEMYDELEALQRAVKKLQKEVEQLKRANI